MPGQPNGISGLQGFVKSAAWAPSEEVQGGPVDPSHTSIGEQAKPYSWVAYGGALGMPHGPYGPENELLSDVPENQTFAGGHIAQDPQGDLTPYRTHAAPWPKGLQFGEMSSASPEGTAQKLEQSASIHASDTNASEKFIYAEEMWALQDDWVGFFNPVQGEDLVPPVPGSVGSNVAGFGNNDHVNNAYAKVNSFNFNTSHRHRRYAAGTVPGNYMWMRPGGRLMVKSLPGPARPAVGPDSPFAGDDTFAAFGIDGAILQTQPTEYVAPPTPYVQPQLQNTAVAAPGIDLW